MGTTSVNDALPTKPLKALSGGKELPSPDSSKKVSGQDQDGDARIKELRQPGSQQTEKVVDDLNKAAVSLRRDLNFKVDDETGKSIITVTDSITQKVIRQIPSEEIVELAKNLQSMVQKADVEPGNAQQGSPTGSLLNITA
ncbi:MAG: flagellar protein FlaG [Pseudomonadales bacterium]|nr:flagellar protein FlaG [Pseudomonadales bacterium]